MDEEDTTRLQEGIHLAQTGQKRMAYDQFCIIRQRGNAFNTDVLFWIIFTTPYTEEAKQTLETIANINPGHPKLPEARAYYNRHWNAHHRRSWFSRHPIVTTATCIIAVLFVLVTVSNANRSIVFSTSHQITNLPLNNSPIFQVSGAIDIDYSCQYDTKVGVDAQFNLWKVDSSGEPETFVWMRRVECPTSSVSAISVPAGAYRVAVSCYGDVDWSMTVTQV